MSFQPPEMSYQQPEMSYQQPEMIPRAPKCHPERQSVNELPNIYNSECHNVIPSAAEESKPAVGSFGPIFATNPALRRVAPRQPGVGTRF